jgi:hypothetical protein
MLHPSVKPRRVRADLSGTATAFGTGGVSDRAGGVGGCAVAAPPLGGVSRVGPECTVTEVGRLHCHRGLPECAVNEACPSALSPRFACYRSHECTVTELCPSALSTRRARVHCHRSRVHCHRSPMSCPSALSPMSRVHCHRCPKSDLLSECTVTDVLPTDVLSPTSYGARRASAIATLNGSHQMIAHV